MVRRPYICIFDVFIKWSSSRTRNYRIPKYYEKIPNASFFLIFPLFLYLHWDHHCLHILKSFYYLVTKSFLLFYFSQNMLFLVQKYLFQDFLLYIFLIYYYAKILYFLFFGLIWIKVLINSENIIIPLWK